MSFKPLKKTKTFEILKEVKLAGRRGLTNMELAERVIGISDSSRRGYRRLSALTSHLEKEGFLKKVGYEENALARSSPVRGLTERGKGFLELARKGAEIATRKIRAQG